MSASSSAPRFTRRRLMGAVALGLAASGGVATVMQSTAHDDQSHEVPASTPPASPAASPEVAANTFVIETHDTYFTPKEISIPADTEVTLKIVNKGLMQHDFVCDPLKLSSGRLNAGDEGELKVTAKKGSYQFYCSVPGHKILGMVGVLKVA